MDPAEIWQSIVKADELLKYATEAKAEVRKEQAVALLRQALSDATAAGNDPLMEQARTRLRDLGVGDG